MTIPEKPLVLSPEAADLTLADARVFDGEEWEKTSRVTMLSRVREWLVRYSVSWTPDEIDQIRASEMEGVAASLKGALAAVSVPLGPSQSSKTTPGSKATKSRPGRSK